MTNGSDGRALIRYALVGLALTVAASWMLYLIRYELLLIYIAVLMAIGLSPIVNFIERPRHGHAGKPWPRWVAILAIYLCIVTGVVCVGLVTVPPLAEQSQALWTAFPDILHRGQLWLLDRHLLTRELSVREAMQQVPVGGDALGAVVGAIGTVIGGLFGVLTVLIMTFYMLVDADRIVETCLHLFPVETRSQVREASRRAARKVSAWLGGQLLVGAVIGGSAALGLWVMGVPYFYVLALIAGIGELIPMIGPILSAIPAVAVALTVSPALGLAVLIFFIVQQQVENNLLVPKIMARQVGVSALIVIVALLIGTSLLGVLGAILAVPTAAILQVLFEELLPTAPTD